MASMSNIARQLVSMRLPSLLVTALGRAATRNFRTRTEQVVVYVREGLGRDGLLPEGEVAPVVGS